MNFQMFQLVLENAEEPEIKLPTCTGSQKKQENSRKKHLLLLHWLYTKAFDYMDHNKLWKILKEMGIHQNTLPASWETCMQVMKQQLELDMEQLTAS